MKLMLTFAATASLLSASSALSQSREGRSSYTVITTGAPIVQGSGNFVSQTRTLQPFDSIESTGASRIEVVIGDMPSIEVEIDDNIIEKVETRVERGVLRIEEKGSFRTARAPVVRITMPKLDSIALKGSSDAQVRGLRGGDVSFASHGSGSFDVGEGRADKVALVLSGSGATDISRLVANEVVVTLSGSGRAKVRAEKSIQAILSGSGEIVYGGPTHDVNVIVSGSGKVRRAAM